MVTLVGQRRCNMVVALEYCCKLNSVSGRSRPIVFLAVALGLSTVPESDYFLSAHHFRNDIWKWSEASCPVQIKDGQNPIFHPWSALDMKLHFTSRYHLKWWATKQKIRLWNSMRLMQLPTRQLVLNSFHSEFSYNNTPSAPPMLHPSLPTRFTILTPQLTWVWPASDSTMCMWLCHRPYVLHQQIWHHIPNPTLTSSHLFWKIAALEFRLEAKIFSSFHMTTTLQETLW